MNAPPVSANPAPGARLPRLREDIAFSQTDRDASNAEAWVIHDPLQNRYFRINAVTKDILGLWRENMTLEDLAETAISELGISVTVDQLSGLVTFVQRNSLSVRAEANSWRQLARQAEIAKPKRLSQLVHSYLFFKIPLFHPQRALRSALPLVETFYRGSTIIAIGIIGLIGIYLVSRQWDVFTHTFQNFLSLEGALWFGVCLLLVKVAHELGHAFTAVRFGCQVPTMGVAFMFMTPMLYTDVTDAWRLDSRRQRLLIHAAGVIVEIGIACVATFAWTFVPDGPLRGAIFMVAATSWIVSLGLNLNPFMRFDGYFLLSELWRVENLQPRAFELGRWKLRQLLLVPSLAPPERLPHRLQNGLIAYAWCTWIYRLVVFTGIAVLVYQFFFKALGIVLFLIEIWYFVAKPIFQELLEWRRIARSEGAAPRTAVIAGFGLITCLILVVPWSSRIEIPAVLSAADLAQVYPTRPARIVSIDAVRGDQVAVGATLAKLDTLEVEKDLRDTATNIDLIKMRLGRAMADADEREQYLVLSRKLTGLQTKLEGLRKEHDELTVRAPIAGTVLEIGPDLHPGRWIKKSDLIGLIATQKHYVVRGYIAEADLARLKPAATGRFIPDDLTRPSIPVTLSSVARSGVNQIEIPELASVHGGRVAAEADASQKLTPLGGQYLVELKTRDVDSGPNQVVRGVVELHGQSTSVLTRIVRTTLQVLIRESGF